jgi:hypothetical protein
MNAGHLLLACVSAGVLAGCVSGRSIDVATYTATAVTPDADGWYRYSTYWFKGTLTNNQPNGFGQCKTQYLNPRTDKRDWVEAPCEFKAGVRVDEYHLARTEATVADYKAERDRQNRRERENQEAAESYRRQEAAESRAAANAAGAALVMQLQAQNQQLARTLAQNDRQVAQATRQANDYNAQRQADVNEAARQRQRDNEAAALQKVKDRQSAADAGASQRKAETDLKLAMAADEKKHNDEALAAKNAREAEAKRQQDLRDAEAKRAKDKADREAAKAKEKADEEAAKVKYLRDLATGTKLMARKCPSGDGSYFVVGLRPRIKPEVVGCVDVHYRARCDGAGVASDGVGKNFTGAFTDCYMGDTYQIEQKPACPVERVRVEVREVRACNE